MTTSNPKLPGGADDTNPVRSSFDRLRIDHTHTRYHHRIARALADRLPNLLDPDEKVLGFTEAIEDSDFPTRAIMGYGWPLWHRVALLFTDRRLLEVGLTCSGRRARGRVRSFPWDRIQGFEAAGLQLEIATWHQARHRWHLRQHIAGELERTLRRQVDLAVSTYQPSQGLSAPIRQCGRCGAPVRAPYGSCGDCGMRVRSSRLAGILALAFPGAGHCYTRRGFAAFLRLALECAMFSWLASQMLSASTLTRVVASAVVGAVVLGTVKLQGAAVARRLAARAELVSPIAERRWHWLAGFGAALSLAALLLPLSLIGQTDSHISWDLDFVMTDDEWTGHPASPPVGGAAPDDALRSRWLHRNGLHAEVRAWPMRPFESPAAAGERFASQEHGHNETLVLGPHRVVTSRVVGESSTTLRYAVIDEEGRDVHVVSSDVSSEHTDDDADLLERLISRGIWVPPTSSRANGS